MNNEQNNRIINDAYENYYKNAETSNLIDSHYEPATNKWHLYNRQEFIDKCKKDEKFSNKWGLKIEESEILQQVDQSNPMLKGSTALYPRKLITITYKDKKIEVYE